MVILITGFFTKNICLVNLCFYVAASRQISSVMHLGLQFKNNKELVAPRLLVAKSMLP
jgi:hypothetical protein